MSETHLATERLDLRRWREADAPRVLDIHSRPEVTRWLGDGPPVLLAGLDAARERIAGDNRVAQTPGLGHWAVEVRATGVVAGSVMLVHLPGSTDVQVGWHLHPDSVGHGYAREAAAAVLDHGLGTHDEVWALTHLDNYPSLAVARAIGMTDLGVTDRWYGSGSRVFRATHP